MPITRAHNLLAYCAAWDNASHAAEYGGVPPIPPYSGCINPCTSLPNAAEMIDFVPSRKRVIAIINDLKGFAGSAFPARNGKRIPNAFVVIDGEPEFHG